MQCKEWGDANSELFKEPHDEAVHKNSYKSRLCELIRKQTLRINQCFLRFDSVLWTLRVVVAATPQYKKGARLTPQVVACWRRQVV